VLKHAVIVDVEATTAIRQAEVGAAKTMLDRTAEQFDVSPSRLVADGGYGSAEMVGWLVDERGIEPHVKLIDQGRAHGRDLLSQRLRLRFGAQSLCLPRRQRAEEIPPRFRQARDGVTKDGTMIFFARKQDCEACALKPNKPLVTRLARSQRPRPTLFSCRERKKVEMLFAHLKRILRLGRLRLRGPKGAKDEFLLAATAQNLRKMAKLIPLPAPIFAT
jgi:hypothetical protein